MQSMRDAEATTMSHEACVCQSGPVCLFKKLKNKKQNKNVFYAVQNIYYNIVGGLVDLFWRARRARALAARARMFVTS
jgi:hypothetical protein